MSRLFRAISGVATRNAPQRVSAVESLLKGARRIVVTRGAHDHPGHILLVRRNANASLASDWQAIGGDMKRAYFQAAGESGVLVEAAHAVGAASLKDGEPGGQ